MKLSSRVLPQFKLDRRKLRTFGRQRETILCQIVHEATQNKRVWSCPPALQQQMASGPGLPIEPYGLRRTLVKGFVLRGLHSYTLEIHRGHKPRQIDYVSYCTSFAG